jgi:hypothetical protein
MKSKFEFKDNRPFNVKAKEFAEGEANRVGRNTTENKILK